MTKIEMAFTKAELQLLIKLLYTGYYVCDREEESDDDRKAKELLVDRFLQSALSYRIMDGIEYVPKYDRHFLDADHEDRLLEEYNDFIEDSFWDELVFRLARRDFVNAIGEAEFEQMDTLDRMKEEEKYKERYRDEFERNGIQRVGIAK